MKEVLSNGHWPQRAGFAAKNNPSQIGGGTFALAGPGPITHHEDGGHSTQSVIRSSVGLDDEGKINF
jgi:hypothetical protein